MTSSTLIDLLPFFALSLLLLSALLLQTKKKIGHNLPPGPRKLPIIGHLHLLGDSPQRSLLRLAKAHGPLIHLQLGVKPTVVASSAETARAILKSNDLDCCSRPTSVSADRITYGYSDLVFSPYSDTWRELRKICIVEFFSSKKGAMFRPIREQEVARMINSISGEIDLSHELLVLANNVTSRAVLGQRQINEETGEGSRLPEMIKETQAVLAGFFVADYLPALGWIDSLTGMRARLDKVFDMSDQFYGNVIDEHRSPGRKPGLGGEDTLDALLRIQKDTPHITDHHIKSLLMNIFVGGSDTSSATVEWTMTELMKKPEELKKAQDEVRRLIGSRGKVEESDLPELHYMQCILKEAMRLHPPAPLLVPRETLRDCNVNGFDIPARTTVIVNAYAVGRDKECWECPEEFRPERFVDSPIDVKGHDYGLIPFGAGRRICPGIHVGMAVVELALANLLYCFDWELPAGMKADDIDMREAPGITVHRRTRLRLVAKKYER